MSPCKTTWFIGYPFKGTRGIAGIDLYLDDVLLPPSSSKDLSTIIQHLTECAWGEMETGMKDKAWDNLCLIGDYLDSLSPNVDGLLHRVFKIMGCLTHHVQLRSGVIGVMCGVRNKRWLVFTDGQMEEVELSAIEGRSVGHGGVRADRPSVG